MEAIVFSLIRDSPEKVLADHCKAMGLDQAKYTCHAIAFSDYMRVGRGWLIVRKEGDQFHGGIN